MKKLVAILLLCICTLSFVACGSKEQNSNTVTTQNESKSEEKSSDTKKEETVVNIQIRDLNQYVGLTLPEFLSKSNIKEVTNDGFNGYQVSEWPNKVDSTGAYLYKYASSAPKTPVDLEKSFVAPQTLGSVCANINDKDVAIVVKNDTEKAITYKDAIVVGYVSYEIDSELGASLEKEIKAAKNSLVSGNKYSYIDSDNRFHLYNNKEDVYIYGDPYLSFTNFASKSKYDDVAIQFDKSNGNRVNYDASTLNTNPTPLTEFTMGNNKFNVAQVGEKSPSIYLSAEGFDYESYYATSISVKDKDKSLYTGAIYDGMHRMTEDDFIKLIKDIKALSEYVKVGSDDTCSVYVKTSKSTYETIVFNSKLGIAWKLISLAGPNQVSTDELAKVAYYYNDIINKYISK